MIRTSVVLTLVRYVVWEEHRQRSQFRHRLGQVGIGIINLNLVYLSVANKHSFLVREGDQLNFKKCWWMLWIIIRHRSIGQKSRSRIAHRLNHLRTDPTNLITPHLYWMRWISSQVKSRVVHLKWQIISNINHPTHVNSNQLEMILIYSMECRMISLKRKSLWYQIDLKTFVAPLILITQARARIQESTNLQFLDQNTQWIKHQTRVSQI